MRSCAWLQSGYQTIASQVTGRLGCPTCGSYMTALMTGRCMSTGEQVRVTRLQVKIRLVLAQLPGSHLGVCLAQCDMLAHGIMFSVLVILAAFMGWRCKQRAAKNRRVREGLTQVHTPQRCVVSYRESATP